MGNLNQTFYINREQPRYLTHEVLMDTASDFAAMLEQAHKEGSLNFKCIEVGNVKDCTKRPQSEFADTAFNQAMFFLNYLAHGQVDANLCVANKGTTPEVLSNPDNKYIEITFGENDGEKGYFAQYRWQRKVTTDESGERQVVTTYKLNLFRTDDLSTPKGTIKLTQKKPFYGNQGIKPEQELEFTWKLYSTEGTINHKPGKNEEYYVRISAKIKPAIQ